MRQYLLIALLAAAIVLPGCASLSDINAGLRTATATVQAPLARDALFAYLPTDELVDIGPSVQLLDATLTEAERVISGDSDVELNALLTRILGAPEALARIDSAFVAVERAVAAYSAESGEPVPATLEKFGRDARAQRAALQRLIDRVDAAGEVREFMGLLRLVALSFVR